MFTLSIKHLQVSWPKPKIHLRSATNCGNVGTHSPHACAPAFMYIERLHLDIAANILFINSAEQYICIITSLLRAKLLNDFASYNPTMSNEDQSGCARPREWMIVVICTWTATKHSIVPHTVVTGVVRDCLQTYLDLKVEIRFDLQRTALANALAHSVSDSPCVLLWIIWLFVQTPFVLIYEWDSLIRLIVNGMCDVSLWLPLRTISQPDLGRELYREHGFGDARGVSSCAGRKGYVKCWLRGIKLKRYPHHPQALVRDA